MEQEFSEFSQIGDCTVRSNIWRWMVCGQGALYSEVRCIMANGQMGPLCGQNNGQIRLKT